MVLSNAMDCMPPELSAIGTPTIVYEKLDDLQETICKHWGWEFVVDVLKIPAEKLWVTIHTEDDEAFKIWHEEIGLAPRAYCAFRREFLK